MMKIRVIPLELNEMKPLVIPTAGASE